MGAAESLAAWGIRRAPEVVELAAQVGLDLASAATLLEIESAGGHNVWGHDGVSTGGAYVKGAEVTRAAYETYRTLRKAGKIGAQGVGPCQLTWHGYQEQADAIGGCWDWRCNVRVGFGVLLGHVRSYGLRGGFRRYNGSGPAAEAYADKAMARRTRWLARLGDAAGTPPAPTTPTTEDDDVPWTKQDGAPAVPDFYAGQGKTLPDPLAALAWSATHAAHARDRASEALTEARQTRTMLAAAIGELAALARTVDELKAELKTTDRTAVTGGPSVDPEALIDAIAERLAQRPS